MVFAVLVGYELLVVALAGFVFVFMLSASILGIFRRLTRGRLSRNQRDGAAPAED